MTRCPLQPPLFPYTTLFRSRSEAEIMRKRSLDMVHALARRDERVVFIGSDLSPNLLGEMKKEYPSRYYMEGISEANVIGIDRKSTRLNFSHTVISYAVFCLK